jgi:lipoate-protein ligase A
MQLLDLSLPTPAENLALDEALLEAAETGQLADEVLRLWELPSPAVIIGRSSRIAGEIDLDVTESLQIPVLRRASGGAAIVAGPGCQMYSVVLRYAGREHLRLLDEVHRHVLGIIRSALAPLIDGIEHQGTSDLALNKRKFSGNSLRCKRDHLLYHGTILYNYDLSLIPRLLKTPPRQPDYRENRTHADFITNLPLAAPTLRTALTTAFFANQPLTTWPHQLTNHLLTTRYSQSTWNFSR